MAVMTHKDENFITLDLAEVASRLEAERPLPSEDELDRMRIRALRGHGRERPRVARPSLMRTRVAFVAMIVVGALMSAGGGALALSGSSNQGSAAQSVYPQPPPGDIVRGEEELTPTIDEGSEGEPPTIDEVDRGPAGPSDVQRSAQKAAVGDERELPVTGLAALPLVLAGVVLIVAGLVLRRRTRPAQ
jgi:hypothetical protein